MSTSQIPSEHIEASFQDNEIVLTNLHLRLKTRTNWSKETSSIPLERIASVRKQNKFSAIWGNLTVLLTIGLFIAHRADHEDATSLLIVGAILSLLFLLFSYKKVLTIESNGGQIYRVKAGMLGPDYEEVKEAIEHAVVARRQTLT